MGLHIMYRQEKEQKNFKMVSKLVFAFPPEISQTDPEIRRGHLETCLRKGLKY